MHAMLDNNEVFNMYRITGSVVTRDIPDNVIAGNVSVYSL